MQQIPLSQARANLADTLRRVESGTEPALISRRGEPAAVLMSLAQYRRLSGASQDFAGLLGGWRQHYLGDDAPADDPWADVRDPSPGREVAW
jgi:prevent-host-death family protein